MNRRRMARPPLETAEQRDQNLRAAHFHAVHCVDNFHSKVYVNTWAERGGRWLLSDSTKHTCVAIVLETLRHLASGCYPNPGRWRQSALWRRKRAFGAK